MAQAWQKYGKTLTRIWQHMAEGRQKYGEVVETPWQGVRQNTRKNTRQKHSKVYGKTLASSHMAIITLWCQMCPCFAIAIIQ